MAAARQGKKAALFSWACAGGPYIQAVWSVQKRVAVSFSQHLGQSLGSLRQADFLVLSPGSLGVADVWSDRRVKGTDSCELPLSKGSQAGLTGLRKLLSLRNTA